MAKTSAATKKSPAAASAAKPDSKLVKPKKAATKTQAQKAAAKAAASPPAPDTPTISAGDRVAHDKFGHGTVLSVLDDKLEIEFKTVGAKWIVKSFLDPV